MSNLPNEARASVALDKGEVSTRTEAETMTLATQIVDALKPRLESTEHAEFCYREDVGMVFEMISDSARKAESEEIAQWRRDYAECEVLTANALQELKASQERVKELEAIVARPAQAGGVVVWAGANPFTGPQVLDLLNENESLRSRLSEVERERDEAYSQTADQLATANARISALEAELAWWDQLATEALNTGNHVADARGNAIGDVCRAIRNVLSPPRERESGTNAGRLVAAEGTSKPEARINEAAVTRDPSSPVTIPAARSSAPPSPFSARSCVDRSADGELLNVLKQLHAAEEDWHSAHDALAFMAEQYAKSESLRIQQERQVNDLIAERDYLASRATAKEGM